MPATTMVLTPRAETFADAIAALRPAAQITLASTTEEAIAKGAEVEVLVTLGSELRPGVLAAMPRLRWIQALSAGTDQVLQAEGLRDDVAVTSLSGAHGPQMSELALMLMMALLRDLPATLENQRARAWKRGQVSTLVGRRLCILGLGAIAEALVARALPFGMQVTGVSDGRQAMDGVAHIRPYAQLAEAAEEADFLCVLAPLTARSRHIVDAAVLRALGPQGYLISMGRGPVIDEAALIAALQQGTIAGAGLDVFEVEPLPQDNPLWTAPNTIITPHVGGLSDTYPLQAAPIVADNLDAWERGGPDLLRNRVR